MNKVAVIGLGNISKRHRANIKRLYPEAVVFAVSASGRQPCEPIENADEFLSSIDELLQHKPDMAIVASPATFHAQHAIPFLKNEIPVLIEKPLSGCEWEAASILAAEKQYKTPATVGYCLRYLPSSQYIKLLLEDNLIGEIYNAFVEVGQYLPDWRPSQNYRESVSASAQLGGGVLLELSHELDYIQWLLGPLQYQHAILRSSKDLQLPVEDSADILALNVGGTVVSVHLDFLQRKVHRKCRFIGSEGSLEWDLLRNEITFSTKGSERQVFSQPEWDKNQMYLDMLQDFEGLINGKPNSCVTLDEAQRTVSLITKIKSLALTTKGLR